MEYFNMNNWCPAPPPPKEIMISAAFNGALSVASAALMLYEYAIFLYSNDSKYQYELIFFPIFLGILAYGIFSLKLFWDDIIQYSYDKRNDLDINNGNYVVFGAKFMSIGGCIGGLYAFIVFIIENNMMIQR